MRNRQKKPKRKSSQKPNGINSFKTALIDFDGRITTIRDRNDDVYNKTKSIFFFSRNRETDRLHLEKLNAYGLSISPR